MYKQCEGELIRLSAASIDYFTVTEYHSKLRKHHLMPNKLQLNHLYASAPKYVF